MNKDLKTLLLIGCAFMGFAVASCSDYEAVSRARVSSAPTVNNSWQQATTCPPLG